MTKNIQPMRLKTIMLIAVVFLATACIPQQPIIIEITPTPIPQSEEPTAIPTVVIQAQSTTIAQAVLPTDTTMPLEPTVPPTQVGDGQFFGPIVGSDYTPPPTSTSPPPTPEPSATPIPPITLPNVNVPVLDPSQMGLQLEHNVDINHWWELIAVHSRRMNVGWIKMQANWAFLQPNGPDEFENKFRLFQSHVQRAYNEGFRVLVSVAKAPDWARDNLDEDGPPTDPQLLANFMTFMLERMGNEIGAIEVWNEPNLSREWNTGLAFNGTGYMRLFEPSYSAIRAYDPNMIILTAGLAPTSGAGAVDDRLYLQQMYDAGLAQFRDIGIGIHPYGWGNAPDARCCNNIPDRGWDDDPHFFFLDNIEDYRDIMVRNGHSDVQMWPTEFGWHSWEGLPIEAPEPWMNYTDNALQAEYTIRAFEIGQTTDYIGPMILWNLNFSNPDLLNARSEMVGYSIFQPGLPVRPIFELLANRPLP